MRPRQRRRIDAAGAWAECHCWGRAMVDTANRIQTCASRPNELLRILGVVFGIALGIGSMVGAGILRTPGAVAAGVPSAWWIVALWTFGGVHALLGANVVAELFSADPRAGGLYVPVRRAFGDLPGLIVGWSDVLANAASVAALAIVAVEFLAFAWSGFARMELTLASAIIAGLVAINAIGVREGRAAQILTTGLKIALLFAIIVGAMFIPSGPAVAQTDSIPAPVIAGAALFAAYQLVYGAYSGWYGPVYFAEEDVAPSRNIPRVLLSVVTSVMLLYLGINFALLHSISVAELGKSDIPVRILIDRMFGPLGALMLAVTGFTLVVGCLNSALLIAPRTMYALGRDGLLPRFFTQVGAGGTPQAALLFFGTIGVAMVATGSFESAFRLMGALGAVALLAVDLSLFSLRLREPRLERPFQALAYPALPLAALAIDALLLCGIIWYDPTSGWITLATVTAIVPIWWVMTRARAGSLDSG